MDLSTTYMKLELRNPVLVGSCGLTGTKEGVKACADNGAGAVVLKSIFEEQIEAELGAVAREGAAYPEAADYINRYGMRNAVSRYLELLEESNREVDIPVIPSIHCFGVGDWTGFARRLEDAGAPAIELNAFVFPSDPSKNGREYEKVILDLVTAVKERVSIPVAVKIGSYFSAPAHFIKELDSRGVDALVLFNRFVRIDFDIEKLKITNGTMLSTPDETQEVLRWVGIVTPFLKCDVSSTTGIHDGASVVKHLLAGASTVQVSSVLYREGLGTLSGMLGFVVRWMKKHGFEKTNDFKGMLNRSGIDDPGGFERVQFMKASTGT